MAEWQSIETAPKDGTHFLAWSEGYGPTEARFDGAYNDGEPAWVACHQDTDFHPTHWMPLPDPPALTQIAAGQQLLWCIHSDATLSAGAHLKWTT